MASDLSEFKSWTGSQAELVKLVSEIGGQFGSGSNPISKRTFVYYREKGVISPANGKKYHFLHLVQCLAARRLAAHGWTIKQLVQLISSLDESQLKSVTLGEIEADAALELTTVSTAPDTVFKSSLDEVDLSQLPLPVLAVHMLAVGVCDVFGRIVDGGNVVDGNDIPFSLKRAMCLLGRLCLESGQPDSFASIHKTLALCKLPFNHSQWPIRAFKEGEFQFSSINLIDKDHRCPTQDCIELASVRNEANLKEQFSFELLTQLCSGFGTRKHEVYRAVREFIGRNPTSSIREITEFAREQSIVKVEAFLTREVYSPIDSHILINGKLHQCSTCGAPIRQVDDSLGACTIKQCAKYGKHVSLTAGVHPADDAVVLSPHLLSFWFGPSIDELEVFDLALTLDYEASLYPESDACDVSIDGYDIGIDIKSYASPYLLAHALNRSIGRLTRYNIKIIAISDESISRHKDYLQVVKKQYKNNDALDFRSVSSLKKWLKEGIR